MKKIYYIIALVCLAANSCSLDEKSYTKVDMDTYIKDAGEAQTVLLGIYRQMNVDGIYGLNLSMLFNMPTDEAKVEGNSLVGARLQANNAFSTSDSYVQGSWGALYKGIYYANSFLEAMEDRMKEFSSKDKALGEIYMAEARALRALFYFELVRWYGNVPLVTSTAQSALHPSQFEQAAPEAVYGFIESDLQYAIDVLPYASDDNLRADNSFRISKGAALGLMTKVYATWAGYPLNDSSKWEDAAKTAEELVSSGRHSLLPDFETLWKNAGNNVWDSRESLLEVSFYSPQSTNTSSGRVGKWNGVTAAQGSIKGNSNFAIFKVVPTFLKEWKEENDGDLRWGMSFADYKYTVKDYRTALTTAKINDETVDVTFEMAMDETLENWKMDWRKQMSFQISPKKWDTELYVEDANQLADNNYSNVNWYLLRYSDVLLLYAEALNEVNQGPVSEAYNAVNMVRRRAFGLDVNKVSSKADLPAGLSYTEFRDAIRDERSYELAFEGHRRQDLTRWGIYYERVQETYYKQVDWHELGAEYYIGAQYTYKNKNELLPIPQREMDLCSRFVQNQGWK